MAGAKQPIALIQAKGKKHLTKSEIEKRSNEEVIAESDNIVAPDYLNANQKKKFNSLADELKNINIISNLDCDLLANFIIANSQYVKYTKMLNSSECKEDIFMCEKVANLQDKFFKQCLSTSKELGLTISSRCKLVVPKVENEEPSKWQNVGGMSG